MTHHKDKLIFFYSETPKQITRRSSTMAAAQCLSHCLVGNSHMNYFSSLFKMILCYQQARADLFQ